MTPKEDVTAERTQQIYQAAMTCFNRKGYHQTTMDDIVAESGLSKGTLYWYFDSKKALFIGLLHEFLGSFGQEWEAIVADRSITAKEKLAKSLAMFRVQFEEMVSFFGIIMEAWTLTHYDDDVQQLSKEVYEPYQIIIKQILDEGVAQGDFESEDTLAAAKIILTMYDGLTLAVGTGILEDEPEILLNAAETIVFRGIGMEGS